MTATFHAMFCWLRTAQHKLDQLLYRFSVYVLPVCIALVTGTAFIAWNHHYSSTGATALAFRVAPAPAPDLLPRQALEHLALPPF